MSGLWDSSRVTNFERMLLLAFTFNQDLSFWNTSNGDSMLAMFQNAFAFNQNIAAWDVRNVCTLEDMFRSAIVFDQNLNSWMKQLTTQTKCKNQPMVSGIFEGTSCSVQADPLPRGPFCQYDDFPADGLALKTAVRCYVLGQSCNSLDLPGSVRGTGSKNVEAYYGPTIGSWRTGRVETFASLFSGMSVSTEKSFRAMFRAASSFNRRLSSWNTSSATDMAFMFDGASKFNGAVGGWDTGQVTDFEGMFRMAAVLNQGVAQWNTASAQTMASMFAQATHFNQDLSGWQTGRVSDLSAMFADATSFNRNISGWATARVTSFRGMFASATSFNQNVAAWNVRDGYDFRAMFRGAIAFNQDLNAWKQQLTTRTKCTSAPSVFNMFQKTVCPITTDPLPNGPFCRKVPTARLKTCLSNALGKRTRCCSQPKKYRDAMKSDCRQAFERLGGDEATLNRLTNRIFNQAC